MLRGHTAPTGDKFRADKKRSVTVVPVKYWMGKCFGLKKDEVRCCVRRWRREEDDGRGARFHSGSGPISQRCEYNKQTSDDIETIGTNNSRR